MFFKLFFFTILYGFVVIWRVVIYVIINMEVREFFVFFYLLVFRYRLRSNDNFSIFDMALLITIIYIFFIRK